MKFYDAHNRRLVFLGEKASDHFWDKLWLNDPQLAQTIKRGEKEHWLKKVTKHFLPSGGRVLEGGCGRGDKVYGLKSWGYDAYGIDFADETIKKIKSLFPELKVQTADVRKLPFSDNFFDGYWSIGVIEHFYEGFSEIVSEMARVLKPGGYAFVTFPYMSPLRRLKAKLGLYPAFNSDKNEPPDFYQFALPARHVIKIFNQYNLQPVYCRPMDAVKGLKDEVSWLTPLLRWVYRSRSIVAKGIRFGTNTLFSRLSSHVILIVFQKYAP